jgi:hypothetical protein
LKPIHRFENPSDLIGNVVLDKQGNTALGLRQKQFEKIKGG